MPSAAGDALQRFPPTVAAFCTWIDPTWRAAARSPSKHPGRSAVATSAHRVSAPIR